MQYAVANIQRRMWTYIRPLDSLKVVPLLASKERDRVMEARLQAGPFRVMLTGRLSKLVTSSVISPPKQNCSCTTVNYVYIYIYMCT